MFESRKELFSKIEGLEAVNKQLEADLAAAQEQAKAGTDSEEKVLGLNEDLKAATEENTTLNDKLKTVEADLATAQEAVKPSALAEVAVSAIEGKLDLPTEDKAKVDAALSARITAELASAGHPPLNTQEGKQDELQDFSHLSGLAKATAIHKSQQK